MSPKPKSVTEAVARVRAHLHRRTAIAAGLWGGAVVAGVLALAWVLAGAQGWKQGSWVPLVLDLILVALATALVLAVRKGTQLWFADIPLARAMEGSAGLDDGAVEGTLQLARAVPPGVSPSLAALAERSVVERLKYSEARLSGPLGERTGTWVRRGSTVLALVTPLMALLLVSSPERSLGAWSGLGNPFHVLERPVLPPLEVKPGDLEVLRGSAVDVTVRAVGREEVTLHWQAAGDVARTETVPTQDGDAIFHFAAVDAAIDYSAVVGNEETAHYRITPVDPLLLTDLTIELTFPAYTGRASEEYRGDPPPLEIPLGTRIQIDGKTTLPLSDARLERDQDGLRVPLTKAGTGFSGTWTPNRGGVYSWRLIDEGGRDAAVAPAPFDLTVVSDSAPQIRFTSPAADTVLPLNLRQPLVIEIRDDYGVAAMELVAYRVTSLGERLEPVVQRTELGGNRAVLARPIMDLSSWGLLPGDTVRYFARAVDIAPNPGAGMTREYVLRMPDASELRRGAGDQLEDAAAKLKQINDRANRAAEQARNLQREAQGNQNQQRGAQQQRAQFEQREQLQKAIADQQDMSAQADSARQHMLEIAEAMRDAGASDPSLQQRMDELNQLLEEASSSDLRKQLEQLSAGLDSAATSAPQSTKALEELMKQQEKFKQQLAAAVEMMQRALVEQDFQATTEDAKELALREKALADAIREGSQLPLRRSQQVDLQDAAKALDEHLERLNERLKSIKEEDAQKGVAKSGQTLAQSRDAMEQAREALPDQPEQGAQQADSAGARMQSTSDQLAAAREEMSSRRAQALAETLERTGEQALALARRQSDVQQRLRGADNEQMQQIKGDETSVEQGLRNIADMLARQKAGLSPPVIEATTMINNAGYAIDQARTLMDQPNQRGSTTTVQEAVESVVQALNSLAMVAIESTQQAGGEPDEAANQMMMQLEQLAQAQAQLNNQASQLAPMQLDKDALQKQLDQMAAQQQDVAAELQNLANKPVEQEDKALGDLKQMAAEAAAIAGQMAGGRLDPETRQRQEKLFHRLLDAGRTLEREDTNDERESNTAGTFERSEVQPLGPEALGALKYQLPSAEQLARLTPAERELVIRYFDRLNRAAAGGSAAPTPAPAPQEPPR